MSVLSLPDAKAHLNITSSAYDAELTALIVKVESAIARQTGPLTPTAVTAVVIGGPVLVLPVTPLISLTSVTDDGSGVLALGGLRASTAGVVSSAGGFPYAYYTVIYQAGRTVDAATNADLYLAVQEMLRHKWLSQRGSTTRPGSMPMETIPGAAYSFPYAVSELIAPHIQVP